MQLALFAGDEARSALKPIAKAAGFAVREVSQVDEALHAIREGARTLVVEWSRTAFDGLALLSQCRAAGAENLSVVALLARDELTDELQDQIDEVLLLPVVSAEARLRFRAIARHRALRRLLPAASNALGSLSADLEPLPAFRTWVAAFERAATANAKGVLAGRQRMVHFPLVLLTYGRWLDFFIAIDEGVAGTPEATLGYASSVFASVVDSLEEEGLHLVGPAKASLLQEYPELPALGLGHHRLESHGLRFDIVESPVEVFARVYAELEEGDVTLDPILLPGASSTQLIKEHTVLKSAYIKRLMPFIGETKDDAVLAVKASPLYLASRTNSQ